MEKGKKKRQGKQEALHLDTFTVIIIVLNSSLARKLEQTFLLFPQALVPGYSHTSDLDQK